MNKAKYDALPADLKKVIDANSGMVAAAMFGRAMDEGDKAGGHRAEGGQQDRHARRRRDAALAARGQRRARVWFKEVEGKGINGPKLAQEAEP